jgi:hypothetical protein
MDNAEGVIASTKCWVEKIVLGLNLCPFAHLPFKQGLIRYAVNDSTNEEDLIESLQQELLRLSKASNKEIETTLLIHPNVLVDFFDYNAFLDVADDHLAALELEGIIQIASFHPDYQFADTTYADVENYTNRSPYPILHLIRETSLEKGLEHYPSADNIPERNITTMKELGEAKLQSLMADCSRVNHRQQDYSK